MKSCCSYWDGCQNPPTHEYGGDSFCDEHDVRTPEEATIDSLRAEVSRLKALVRSLQLEITRLKKTAGTPL